MPFASLAQKGFLYANHPEIAKEFQAATPKGATLPQHVRKPSPDDVKAEVQRRLKVKA